MKSQWQVFLFAADEHGDVYFPVGILIVRIFVLLTQPATPPWAQLISKLLFKTESFQGSDVCGLYRADTGCS